MHLLKFKDFLLEFNYKNNVSNEYVKGKGKIVNPWKQYVGDVDYDENEIGDPRFADEADYYKLNRLQNNLK